MLNEEGLHPFLVVLYILSPYYYSYIFVVLHVVHYLACLIIDYSLFSKEVQDVEHVVGVVSGEKIEILEEGSPQRGTLMVL